MPETTHVHYRSEWTEWHEIVPVPGCPIAAQAWPPKNCKGRYSAISAVQNHSLKGAVRQEVDEQATIAKGARVVVFNPANEAFPAVSRKLPLHLLFGVTEEMAVMQEEIFGPLLPVVGVADVGDAIEYVNRHPRPLALYWFGSNAANRERVLAETISGGVTLNDTLFHLAQEELPFGGVGASGYGAYHGERGFLAFTHEKPVFRQARINGAGLLTPPYGRIFDRVLSLIRRLG